MSLFRNWFGIGNADLESELQSNLESSQESYHESGLDAELSIINPATGLVMVGGMCGLDVAGNPYGFSWGEDNRLNDDNGWDSHNIWNADNSGDCYSHGFTSGFGLDPWE